MDNDEKEIRQRYSGLTMAELIELHRSARLSDADAAIVDEMQEFDKLRHRQSGIALPYFFLVVIHQLFPRTSACG